MAKSTPAPTAAAAPAPEAPADAAPAANRLARLRALLTRKVLIVVAGSLVGLSAASVGAYVMWPSAAPLQPAKPLSAKKRKAKAASEAAARAGEAASDASRPNGAEPVLAAASSASAAQPAAGAASTASADEDPMDKLRRRMGEKLGQGATLDAGGAGELRVSRRETAVPARAAPRTPRAGHDKAAQAAGHAGHAAHWSYEGAAGPQAWSRLKPEFAKCGNGSRQSPIDIRDGIQVNLDPVQFDYRPSGFRVIDTGHTVQVNVAAGNFIEVMGRRFELQQFHFHRPSEERIDGKQFDMDVHLVHKDIEGRLAVVAVLLERGSAQGVIQAVWNNLPLERGEEQPAQVSVDLNQLLPAERGYFTYMGSQTTPPCSEGVLWMVMKNPVSVSEQQIGVFSRLYPMNARPVQAASGRVIKESN